MRTNFSLIKMICLCSLYVLPYILMSTVSKWTIAFFFFIIISCGEDPPQPKKDSTPQPQKKDTHQSHKIHNPNDCKAKFMSNKNTNCFHPLPTIKDGQPFTSHYKDTSNIHTKGVTVGRGKWHCQKGTLYQVYRSTCLTCLPGHSLEHCQAQLEHLIRDNP